MKAVGIEPSKSLWFEELTPSSAPISVGEVSMVGGLSVGVNGVMWGFPNSKYGYLSWGLYNNHGGVWGSSWSPPILEND